MNFSGRFLLALCLSTGLAGAGFGPGCVERRRGVGAQGGAGGIVAVQVLVRKQLFVKLVGAYAKSRFEKAFSPVPDYNDTMLSARLRVLHLF